MLVLRIKADGTVAAQFGASLLQYFKEFPACTLQICELLQQNTEGKVFKSCNIILCLNEAPEQKWKTGSLELPYQSQSPLFLKFNPKKKGYRAYFFMQLLKTPLTQRAPVQI